jgi:hypothetical protein
MPGAIIFDPKNDARGFTTTDEQAVGVYLDIENDALYLTDTFDIHKWEGDPSAKLTYIWRSGKIRFPSEVNMGAVLIEADSYDSLIFRLYADNNLVATVGVADGEPYRLPGGYLSNIYEVEIESMDKVTGVTVAQNIFDLSAG